MYALLRRNIAIFSLMAALALMPYSVAAAAVIQVPGNFATIQDAINNAAAGDVIVLGDGDFNEAVDLSLMGSAVGGGHGTITIRPVNPGQATVNGGIASAFSANEFAGAITIKNLRLKADAGTSSVLFFRNTNGLILLHGNSFLSGYGGNAAKFEIQNNADTTIEINGNTFDSPADDADALNISSTGNPTIDLIAEGNSFFAMRNDGIKVECGLGRPVISARIIGNSFEPWADTYFGNAVDFDIGNAGTTAAMASLLIENNVVMQTNDDALAVRLNGVDTAANVIVRDNTIDNPFSAGIYVGSNDSASNLNANVLINHNSITGPGDNGIEVESQSQAEGTPVIHNVVVTQNTVRDAAGCGFFANAYLSDNSYTLNVDLSDNDFDQSGFSDFAFWLADGSQGNTGKGVSESVTLIDVIRANNVVQTDKPDSNVLFLQGAVSVELLHAVASQRIPASVEGLIWNDVNGDGTQNGNGTEEAGMPQIPVSISGTQTAGGTADLATASDINGKYCLPALLPGDYLMTVTPPLEYSFSTGVSATATRSSDMSPDNGQIPITLAQESLTVDVGLWILDPLSTDDDGDGISEKDGDCDDADASIYPGAEEICGDGIDQDCDGEDLICPVQSQISIDDLKSMVDQLDTSRWIKRKLTRYLKRAQRAIDRGNDKYADINMANFIREVVKRSNQKYWYKWWRKRHRISIEQANSLITAAAMRLSGQSGSGNGSIGAVRMLIDDLKTSKRTFRSLSFKLNAAEWAYQSGHYKHARHLMSRVISKTVRCCHLKSKSRNRIEAEDADRLIMAAADALVDIPVHW